MSINDIKLSPFLVVKLYENSLIDVVDKASPISNTQIAKDEKLMKLENDTDTKNINHNLIKHLGKNGKNIVLIIDEKDHAYLSDEALSFLINILNACAISMQDVALVNANNNADVVYENLNAQFEPNKIIFFGTEPQLLNYPIQIPLYKIQAYNNQKYLCASSLQILFSDKEEKKKLWGILKEMFGV